MVMLRTTSTTRLDDRMSLSLYDASVPVFIRTLRTLDHLLEKGEAHARQRGAEPDALLSSRLIFDMLPLARQVQIATDMAKNGAARLAGVDPLRFEDDETTLAQLRARIARAIAYVEAFRPEHYADAATRTVRFRSRDAERVFEGHAYLFGFVLPNLFFHVTTTYNLLRQAGVPIGKADFMGEG